MAKPQRVNEAEESLDTSLRIRKALLEQCQSVADELGSRWTKGDVAIEFIQDMLALAQSEPSKRRMPKILAMLDAARESKGQGFNLASELLKKAKET
jgi:hypothetical protein